MKEWRVKSASDTWFDEAYYESLLFKNKTRVIDPEHAERLGAFVCSYLHRHASRSVVGPGTVSANGRATSSESKQYPIVKDARKTVS